MAETLNRQKEDLTDMGSKLAQAQKRLDESESARDGLTAELSAANERAQVSRNIYRRFSINKNATYSDNFTVQ